MPEHDVANASDASLVACFVAGRDQRAFAELVRRHGSMVMAVARRILGNREDAEDAFQATFLAFACAAKQVKRQAAIAGWLHQTAVRAALRIRKGNAEWQRKKEIGREHMQASANVQRHDELKAVLDDEIQRLPTNYRTAIVLCDLEGLTRREAASRLGVPTTTVSSRVTKARQLLRNRLVRRGVTLSVGGLCAHMARLAETVACVGAAEVSRTTASALLYAAGKSAAEIGTSQVVINTARGVLTAMTVKNLAMNGVVALIILFSAASLGVIPAMLGSVARAVEIVDDFSDGQWNDGSPIDWSIMNGSESSVAVTSENSVRLDSSTEWIRLAATSATDAVSIRARVRVVSDFAGIQFPNQGHWITLNTNGQLDIGGGLTTLVSAPTGLSPATEDVIVQLDWIGDTVSGWAWSVDNPPMSEAPHVQYVTTRQRTFPSFFTNFGAIADFRSITISDQHLPVAVPEPSPFVLGMLFLGPLLVWQRRRSRCHARGPLVR